MKKFTLIIFLFCLNLHSSEFILNNQNVILEKGIVKIDEMITELHQKTGVGVYISAIEKLEKPQTITTYENFLAKDLKKPFVLLSFSRIDKQIDLVISEDLKKVINKDDILDEYIIPILVANTKDTTEKQQHSAAILNGIGEITDKIASSYNVKLDSSIGNESKTFIDGLIGVVKFMLLLTVLAFIYAWYKGRREK